MSTFQPLGRINVVVSSLLTGIGEFFSLRLLAKSTPLAATIKGAQINGEKELGGTFLDSSPATREPTEGENKGLNGNPHLSSRTRSSGDFYTLFGDMEEVTGDDDPLNRHIVFSSFQTIFQGTAANQWQIVNSAATERALAKVNAYDFTPPRPLKPSYSVILEGIVTGQENPMLAGRLTASMLGYRLLPVLLSDAVGATKILSVVVDTPAKNMLGINAQQAQWLTQDRIKDAQHFYAAIGLDSSRVEVLASSVIESQPLFQSLLAEAKNKLTGEDSPLSEADRAPNSLQYFVYQTALTQFLHRTYNVTFKFGAASRDEAARDETRFDAAHHNVFPNSIAPVYGHQAMNTSGKRFAPYLATDGMKGEMPLFGETANMVAFFKKNANFVTGKRPNWIDGLSAQVATFEKIAEKVLAARHPSYPTEISEEAFKPYGVTLAELGVADDQGRITNMGLNIYYLLALKLDYINRHFMLHPTKAALMQSLQIKR